MDSTAKPDVGLPPVKPPSGRFIAQLFVIPGFIILVVVLLFIASALWVKREREPDYFLRQLDSDNLDIRWRGAADLAQILKRPEPATLRWKADPQFAFELADRLDLAFKDLREEETKIAAEIAASTDKDKNLRWRKLSDRRKLVIYLGAALGEFHFPVGAPTLCAVVKHDASADFEGNTRQRRLALWALMNMGENLKGFTKIPDERKHAIVADLQKEAANSGQRAEWAQTALYYLDKSALSSGGARNVTKVDETLAFCANADDRFLRQLTAMALNFWDGEQAEATLLKLAQDRGQGTLYIEKEDWWASLGQ